VLAIVQALGEPELARDFWQAYTGLLGAFRQYGRSAEIKEPLCRAADELYFWLRYGPADADSSHSRLEALQIGPQRPTPDTSELFSMNVNPLTDPDALRALLGNDHALEEAAPVAAEEPAVPGGFVGWKAAALAEALASGDNILLAGPTGTGKTFALHQVVQNMDSFLVTIEGKEGLTDLDFIGAILPQEDGSRRWIDGPLLRAMRQARLEPVLLFLDEVNRIPRVHLNILLGLMNPKSGQACRQMGMDVDDEGPFYIVEAPMTSEIVACPAARLRIVAAGNFGRAYQVYDLDPAVRRRFDTVIEFDYLEYRDELALVRREAPDLGARAAEALVKLAQEKGLQIGGAPDTFLGAGLQSCRKYIDSGLIGDVVGAAAFMICRGHETWHPDPDFYYQKGGGPMLDMGPYYMSALTSLLGRVERLVATGKRTFDKRMITSQPHAGTVMDVNVDTYTTGIMQFESGAIGTLFTTFYAYYHTQARLEVYGTEGTLILPDPNFFGGTIQIYRPETKKYDELPLLFDYVDNMRALGLADMAKSMQTGRDARCGMQQVYHVVDILTAFERSAMSGAWLEMKTPYKRPAPMKKAALPGVLD